jgi:small subunit ribosomal protein S1
VVDLNCSIFRPNPGGHDLRDGKSGTLCARLGRLAAMSNPETPPQTPTTPVASSAAAAPPELSAPPVDAESNGRENEAADVNTDAIAQSDQAFAASPSDGAAPGDASGEKKRRRRRRRRKPGASAGEAGAAEQPEQAGEGSETEDAGEAGAEVAHAEKEESSRGPSHKDRKAEKRHRPQRERPPVNQGDIVFGKILEITDEAIIVDIPGKAHAIFDRRELLLLADEDETKPARAPSATEAGSEQLAGEQSASEQVAADDALVTNGAGGELPVETPETASPEASAEATAVPAESSSVEVAAETAPSPEPERPAAEPPKDPKVPRVILETGADFIAVVHNDGARGGLVVLTHHPNRAEKAKPLVEKAFQEKGTVLGLVTGVIKGGIEVDIDGLRAFAPGSHVDIRMGADLSHLVAERLPFFVTQYAKRGRDVVLSRKSMIEEEARKARTDALAKLKVGDEIDGIVRSVVPFGAFVDIGGIEGLVPLQEMSHNRGDGPSDVFKAGEPTRVQVIKVDDRGKVWLSRKATIPDPWQQVAQKYAQGTRHTGQVVRLQPFGAFIELEPGVDGLIHTQDLSIKRIETPGDAVKVGDSIEVVVAGVDPSQHKIALHPAPQGDMVGEAPQRVAPHKPVKVRVVAIESGGLVVRILGVTGRNARGYITSAGTGTPRGTELRKAFHVGQDVDAKVIEIDPRRGEVKLSIKALSEEQERSAYQQYRQQLKAEARFTLADLIKKGR